MRYILNISVNCLAIASVLFVAEDVLAREPYMDFLRALQKRGYGELALDYLEEIKDLPDVPVQLKQSLNLERSNSLRIAAAEAYDTPERERRLKESEALLEKFQKEYPTHPALGATLVSWGNEQMQRGERELSLMRAAKTPAERDQHASAARPRFEEGRVHFADAIARVAPRLKELPPTHESRPEFELISLEARFKQALSDYLLAQTYADAADPKRKELLTRASGGLDGIFQEFRGQRVAYLSHLWHAKAIEELGDEESAMELYDEVLVGAPDGEDAKPEDAPLFGQAELFRLRLMGKKDSAGAFIEGDEWLKTYRKLQNTGAYQGIALEIAKNRIADAQAGRAPNLKAKLLRESMVMLAAIGKVDSEYRHEAMLLRRDLAQKIGSAEGTLTLPEQIALADEAAANKNWTEALEHFAKATEAAQKAKDAKQTDAIAQRLARIHYQMAVEEFQAGKLSEAFKLAAKVYHDHPKSPVAQQACSLAVAAALQLHLAAPEAQKAESRERLTRIAEFTMTTWPDQPEGDDARMALAQVHMLHGEAEKSLALLAKVNRESRRYPYALLVIGQVYWKQYLEGKKSAKGAESAKELETIREKARSNLATAVERLRLTWTSASEPMPPQLFDAELLLADINLEAGQSKEAAVIYNPLVQQFQSRKPEIVDTRVLRVFAGAVKSNLAAGDLRQAILAVAVLVEIGGDSKQLNSVLVDSVRLIDAAGKKGSDDAVKQALGKLVVPLVGRQHLSLQQLVYLGDLASSLEKNDEARTAYQRVVSAIKSDEKLQAELPPPALIQIRARLVGLLRSNGKSDEARSQVEELIKAQPNALEPLLQKGHILQAQAAKNPKLYDECIAHWTSLRLRLGNQKPRPPEYYDVIYNSALALVEQSEKSKTPDKAQQAEKILKSTLVLSPKLSGPETITRYETLLVRASKLSGLKAPPPKTSPAKSQPAKLKE